MRFNKDRALPGYFTVEASFLVPLATFVVVFLIHTSFLMYGRCVMTQDTYLMAFRASVLREGENRSGYVAENYLRQLGKKYFGSVLPRMEAAESASRVETSSTSKSLRSAYDLVPGTEWLYETDAAAHIINAPAHIRRVDRLLDLMQAGLENLED